MVQTAVDDAVAAATNGEGLRTGGAPVAVPLDALFSFTPSAASAVTYAGATFSASSTAPGVVSVSLTEDGPGVVLTPGADAGTAMVTVDARPEGQPSAALLASVMFEIEVHSALPQPGRLSVTPGDGTLELSWPAVPDADSYTVQWRSGSQDYAESRQLTVDTPSATLTGLTNGMEYTVRVRASNAGGDSAWSEESSGTPMTPVPALPLAGVALLGVLLTQLGWRLRVLSAVDVGSRPPTRQPRPTSGPS